MKFFKSIAYAGRGLKEAVGGQRNLKIQLMVALAAVCLGLYFHIDRLEWGLLLGCCAWVISLELVNTSIEYLTDLVTKEKNPLAGKVKDIAAAAVLFSAVLSGIIGLLIFAKYIF